MAAIVDRAADVLSALLGLDQASIPGLSGQRGVGSSGGDAALDRAVLGHLIACRAPLTAITRDEPTHATCLTSPAS